MRADLPTAQPLLVPTERIDAWRASKLPRAAAVRARLVEQARFTTTWPLPRYTRDQRMFKRSHGVLERLPLVALAYRLTGAECYRESATAVLDAVSGFPDWYPDRFLAVAEMTVAVSLGFSWLYDVLDDTSRARIDAALERNVLAHADEVYGVDRPTDTRFWHAFGDGDRAHNNWNPVCNAGFVLACAALRTTGRRAVDDPRIERTLDAATRSLAIAARGYRPDGVWPEGPTYWIYGTSLLALAIHVLERDLGRSVETIENRGLARTSRFFTALFGPSGLAFNFADSPTLTASLSGAQPAYLWASRRYGDHAGLECALDRLDAQLQRLSVGSGEWSRLSFRSLWFLNVVWMPLRHRSPTAAVPRRPLPDSPVERTVFAGPAAVGVLAHTNSGLWIAIKGGQNGLPHGHLDLGSFVFDYAGVRWAEEGGPGDYTTPGYWDDRPGGRRWQVPVIGNERHNVRTLNGEWQAVGPKVPIHVRDPAERWDAMTLDTTAIDAAACLRSSRTCGVLGPNTVFIVDRLERLRRAVTVDWTMMTRATIDLRLGARGALLSRRGRRMLVEIVAPRDARFEVQAVSDREHVDEAGRTRGELRLLTFRTRRRGGDVLTLVRFRGLAPEPAIARRDDAPFHGGAPRWIDRRSPAQNPRTEHCAP